MLNDTTELKIFSPSSNEKLIKTNVNEQKMLERKNVLMRAGENIYRVCFDGFNVKIMW